MCVSFPYTFHTLGAGSSMSPANIPSLASCLELEEESKKIENED